MRFFAIITKKFLAVVFLILVLIILLISRISSLAIENKVNGSSRNERVNFLRKLGCDVEPLSEAVKDITIPENFSDVYINYNSLQKQAGYDLSRYKGCNCKLFSYDVTQLSDIEKPEYFRANIIVYKGRIIGGDISSAQIDGDMYPLIKRDEKAKIR